MGWYDSSWLNRLSLTVQSGQVDADLTDYPVYVDLDDIGTGHGFWTGVQSDGDDIRITKSDGTTEVPIEVVAIDTTGKTGQMYFKADGTLSSSSNTTYYLYYNNSGASGYASSATYGRDNVWTASYTAVWHLEETPNASANDNVDSTGNGYDLRAQGTTPTLNSSSQFGKGVTFSSGELYSQATTIAAGQPWTNEAWIYSTSTGNQTVHGNGTTGANNRRNLLMYTGTQIQHTESGGDVRGDTANAINNWHFVATTKASGGGTGSVTIYDNGSVDGDTEFSAPSTGTGGTGALRLGRNAGAGEPFVGTIDEARVSSVERASTWISTQYNNQSASSSFYSLGSEESPPSTGQIIFIG